MEIFKFYNKKRQIKSNLFLGAVSLFTVLGVFSVLGNIFNPIVILIASLSSFVSVMVLLKKAGMEFEEILFDKGLIRLSFQNRLKSPVEVKMDEIKISLFVSKIDIILKKDGKLIGNAIKESLRNEEEWQTLVQRLKSED